MAVRKQDPKRPRTARRRLALVATLAGVVWLFGSALAQGEAPQLTAEDLRPEKLFGGQPDNSPTEDGPPPPVLDPANPDHAKLQSPREAFATLPADARGRPDWARALREGAIQPRSGVRGGQEMQLLDLDILMKNTAQMPYVNFPHAAHTAWLACSNCHDGLFVPKAGANPITMPRILQGESCGVCHTKVAFTAMFTCERCHSVPQPGQQRWW